MKRLLPELTFGNPPRPVLVRDECCAFGPPLDVLYLSDFHFTGRSEARAEALLAQVRRLAPSLILLGGDYADTRAGLGPFGQFVQAAAGLAPVLAVAGNHDVFLGCELVRRTVVAAGAQWLEGRSAHFQLGPAHALLVLGNYAAASVPARPGLLRLLVAHEPPAGTLLPRTADLLLAGHLHGGQAVAWQRGPDLYPGRWLARWNGLRYQQNDATLLVSRGLGDTLPLRYRCPHELLRIRLGRPNPDA